MVLRPTTVIDRTYPYSATVAELRTMFAETGAFVRFLEAPAAADDWQAHCGLKTEIVEELFARRKQPANMASGFGFDSKCHTALRELLQEHGLWTPPPPSRPMTMWWRIRMAWRSLRMSFGF